ncbi:MAG TPA: BTAD domain-containing putative transcriptional regulator, partial [Thermoanaerobaculia bacterium]|nr:BTAD domain-containing putative transcriptional regulator [Thermoanaerobaculia bacterium]
MGIEIRLLGGFLVSHEEGRPHFESQKVRALLAYLACHRDVELSRDHLAELLWPEADPDNARRNLRQALYNLRQGLGDGDDGERLDGLGSRAVRLRLDDDDMLDVEAFLDGWRAGMQGSGDLVAADLVRAADLYRGDFLTGFTVRDSPAFDDWVVTEQERLRDAVVQVLRALADHFAARGEYDTAITYCRRLLDVDPLAEEAHRELMRLYVLSGRRRRAIFQYQELERLLDRELGVEPMAETRSLFEAVQSDATFENRVPAEPVRQAPRAPLGPFVVMAGREPSLDALQRSWRAAARGRARLALVEGESGIGKTRLIKTFLNNISSRHQATIARGRPLYPTPWSAAEPLLGVLQGLREADEDEADESAPERLSGAVADHLADRLEERWAGRRKNGPVILYLEDLHLASESVVEAVEGLLDGFAESPLWIVAGTATLDPEHPVHRLAEGDAVDRVPLARLDDPHLIAVCRHLVGDDDADRLARHLFRASEGLPLAMVENINSLCDQGLLAPVGRKRFGLEADPPPVDATAEELARLVVERVDRLPASTRRLISLAAVIGPVFDVDLLQRVSREHIGVVEIGIELMLERWLIRQRARRWSDDPRERDLVLWAQGARRGAFEFAHPAIHAAVYGDLAIHRRRSLHRQLADSLAERYEPAETRAAAHVARHYLLADD